MNVTRLQYTQYIAPLIYGLCLTVTLPTAYAADTTLARSSTASSTVTLAVSANFKGTLHKLLDAFQHTGSTCTDSTLRSSFRIISGASGHLYHQIRQGAPYDLFFSANTLYVDQLYKAGFGAASIEPRTYAFGKLALWHPRLYGTEMASPLVQRIHTSERFATAHPTLAPYGVAAHAYLQTLNGPFTFKRLTANNVSQAFSWIQTGNADMGLVAYAHLLQEKIPHDTFTLLDNRDYPAIRQEMLMLKHADTKPCALYFYAFLETRQAETIIQLAGYTLPDDVKNHVHRP